MRENKWWPHWDFWVNCPFNWHQTVSCLPTQDGLSGVFLPGGFSTLLLETSTVPNTIPIISIKSLSFAWDHILRHWKEYDEVKVTSVHMWHEYKHKPVSLCCLWASERLETKPSRSRRSTAEYTQQRHCKHNTTWASWLDSDRQREMETESSEFSQIDRGAPCADRLTYDVIRLSVCAVTPDVEHTQWRAD